MIFVESFASMGYSAWNVLVAFVFVGGLFAASVKLHQRSAWLQAGFVSAVIATFVVTIVTLAPIVAEAERVNENWQARRETDERTIRRRQQFQPAPQATPAEPATTERPAID